LFETTRDELDLLDGWITESIPTLLGAFGESAIERLKEWVFDLPEKEQSYFKFMKSPLEHFSRENISYLRKISYPEKETPAKKTEMIWLEKGLLCKHFYFIE
jgi:hypothetical protein